MRILVIPCCLLLVFLSSLKGMYITPESIPVDRLLKMGEAELKKHPESDEVRYTLARIHYLAFVCGTKELAAITKYREGRLPYVGPFQKFTAPLGGVRWAEAQKRVMQEMKLTEAPRNDSDIGNVFFDKTDETAKHLEKIDWRPKELPDAAAARHIDEAIVQFTKAMQLDPRNALYRLGYASLLEQARDWAGRHPDAASKFLKGLNARSVRAEYRKAWEMELPADLKDKGRGALDKMDMVSYEAGTAFVRLAEKEAASLTGEEQKTLEKVRASLQDLEKDLMTAMTPIIFAFQPAASIDELLAPDCAVAFPLRGWGPADRWPWVKPDTALLVWNPSRSGRIVSGAQLFGSYTWELFWKTGYDALAVLDVNKDGQLSGGELDGLAAWRDANGNGISDPGEVQSLRDLGVVAIATNATGTEGLHPTNPNGIRFSDGRKLPTWDWVVAPLPKQRR